MALFNKLFTNRRNTHNKHQDNVCEKLFAFNKDQVRVVLFRECDFRGRKLLFDSSSIKKVQIDATKYGENIKTGEHEKVSEISNGHAYIYTKPQADFNQLAEMVFGSVAMSFRGTYFKMHSLESPNRLMYTQVFSSSRPPNFGRVSISSRSEHSKLDDSCASSSNSISEHLSVYSTASDTVLVCRRPQSTPLDVPVCNGVSSSIPSLIGDSGYCADHSYTNMSSGPPSLSTWGSLCGDNGASTMSLSSGSLYKKWLRRNSTSLDNSGQSLANSIQEGRHHHRSSKLGLALILQLTPGQEEEMSQFLMEHNSLLESMLWRARRVVEIAYIKSQNFTSLMLDMAHYSAQYLVNLLSGSHLSLNLWLSLSSGCDINSFNNSISTFSGSSNIFETYRGDLLSSSSFSSSCSDNSKDVEQSEFSLFGLGKFLKADPFHIKKSWFGESKFTAENFLQDFCELLELIDVKDTNFFISTLLTAVLTYHLGWVNTCLPSTDALQTKTPFNPLWGELSDLFGAVGHPTKMAQTIITGTNKKDLVSKILISMTYFIRCCDVDRRIPIRVDIQEDSRVVDAICRRHACIPKENYKKYEDHIKEIMNYSNKEFFVSCQNNNHSCYKNNELEKSLRDNKPALKRTSGLVKTKTCLGDLSQLSNSNNVIETIADANKYSELAEPCSTSKITGSYSSTKEIYALNRSVVAAEERTQNGDIVKSLDKDVVFVLGDDERLVGIKKENKSTTPADLSTKPRPSFLNLTKQLPLHKSNANFCDSDFIEIREKSLIKPSTSWSAKPDNNEQSNSGEGERQEQTCSKQFSRSQSEPPESRKPQDAKNESRYRYSGVKFNLQQYPQILSNYMKSIDLEISNFNLGDKGLKLEDVSSQNENIIKYPEIDEDYEEGEALQTPSNASELEFTSDLFEAPSTTKEANVNGKQSSEQVASAREPGNEGSEQKSTVHKMRVTNLPMPKSKMYKPMINPIKYTSSMMRAASDSYMPDMVLQGPVAPKQEWEYTLKSDLALASQHSVIDQPIEEAVAVIANTDTWEVQLMSSHTFVIDKGSSGIRIGMSQLVANMLESLLQMWKLNVPPHFCLMHIEHTLQELFMRSKALSELLLATEFCSMDKLTSALQLEVNDVPLLLAVASTHSPQVTQKYGLSFQ